MFRFIRDVWLVLHGRDQMGNLPELDELDGFVDPHHPLTAARLEVERERLRAQMRRQEPKNG
jgi:hypothetical protein